MYITYYTSTIHTIILLPIFVIRQESWQSIMDFTSPMIIIMIDNVIVLRSVLYHDYYYYHHYITTCVLSLLRVPLNCHRL